MVDNRINQLLSLINQQIETQETLSQCLTKAEALAMVTMGDNFLDWPKVIVHNYLWVLSDILEQARGINKQTLNVLLKESRQIMLTI